MGDNVTSDRPMRLERNLGLGVLLLLLAGALAVLWPFLSALAWAFVMAFALWPVQRMLMARLRGRRTLVALLMTSAIGLVLALPTLVIVLNLADDARALAGAAAQWARQGPPRPPQWVRTIPLIGEGMADYWHDLADDAVALIERAREQDIGDVGVDALATSQPVDVTATAATTTATTTSPTTVPATALSQTKLGKALALLVGWARQWVPQAGLAIIGGVTQIVLSVLLTFFMFRDGEAIASRVSVGVGRIGGTRGRRLLDVAGGTVRGVVYGILGTAVVQGAMAGIGFLIAGVPGGALLGLITFFLSPLPVGPPLVWLPVALWLFHRGESGWGVFMICWGLLVSSVDNIVKPMIISRGGNTPFVLILLGVIGGALAFGFIGVFLGPTLLAVAYRLVEEWSRTAPTGAASPASAAEP
jgi:predicted PurR-regulated permease PerM